jgi:hypothetical protein
MNGTFLLKAIHYEVDGNYNLKTNSSLPLPPKPDVPNKERTIIDENQNQEPRFLKFTEK